jgi:hypothetical protein
MENLYSYPGFLPGFGKYDRIPQRIILVHGALSAIHGVTLRAYFKRLPPTSVIPERIMIEGREKRV